MSQLFMHRMFRLLMFCVHGCNLNKADIILVGSNLLMNNINALPNSSNMLIWTSNLLSSTFVVISRKVKFLIV